MARIYRIPSKKVNYSANSTEYSINWRGLEKKINLGSNNPMVVIRCLFVVAGMLLLLVFSGTCEAKFNPEKILLKNINLEQGLSQCIATDLAIDDDGFLWVGTFDGLNRFDGTSITTFKHIPGNKTSLPSSKILKLFADKQHHLWVRTANGICIFDTRTGKVLECDLLKKEMISWVCRQDDRYVWAYAPRKGILLVDAEDMSYTIYPDEGVKFSPSCELLDMHNISESVYLTGNCGEILVYDPKENKFTYYPNPKRFSGVFDNSGTDRYGNVYFGSKLADMIYFDVRKHTYQAPEFYRQNINLISVRSVRYDSFYNMLLIGTYGQGLFMYDYQNNLLKQFKKNGDGLQLSSNYVEKAIADRHGVIYLGYDGKGVDVLDPFIKKFTTINQDDPDDLKSLRSVRKILEDDKQRLLIGTGGSGLIRYDRNTSQYEFFNTNTISTISDNFIIEMLQVGDELWLGYNGNGVDILDIHNLRKKGVLEVGVGDQNISEGTIWSMLNDGKGNVWLGTRNNGLNKVDLSTRQVTVFSKADYPQLSSGMRCMTLDKKGNILLGTEDGLFLIEAQGKSIKKVFPKLKEQESIKSFKVIHLDHKGRIWLGTDGMGIAVLDPQYRLLRNFNSTNSLNNDVVYGLLAQNDSTYWISTNAGLTSLQWNDQSLRAGGYLGVYNFDEKNGLQSNEFNTGAYTLLRDGSMAFGGLNGINVFNPTEIERSSVVPKVYLNQFKIFENEWQTDTLISHVASVKLKHFENSISLGFNTIGFSFPGKTKFRYRLRGYNDTWINSGTRNYVSFTNLSSGTYEFQVKACNTDGIWGSEFTSLQIIIATPFYRQWWFVLLLVAVCGQVVWMVYRYRRKLAYEKEQMKILHTKEIAEVEMKALRAQINPHFLFNSLNSINSYILKQDNKLASRYLVKFSQLVRSILNNSSSPYISLQEELNTIELYMLIEGMRFNNQFSYSIEIDPTINAGRVLIPSLLLQPYVENAIWHGLLHKDGEKIIRISVSRAYEGVIRISIKDNGVGRKVAEAIEDKSKKHKSFGMELGENRLKLMNNGQAKIANVSVIDLVDKEGVPSGTVIEIKIPERLLNEKNIYLN